MANIIYLKLQGNKQGLISSGCSTVDSIGNKFQKGHEDEILVNELSSNLSMHQNVNFQPIDIRKPIDKSSPLLSQALTSNEILTCEFFFYRTAMNGGLELYYKVKLTEASLVNINFFCPNSITHNDAQPEESLSIKFKSITWEHVTAGTSSYSIWDDRVY
ncbi:Hcp family type VI secretion system effector [Xenorhabdus bovienii]|uniref:Hcp family type VI secretion system effector n=1 Tax=Xenorhabdus bovienii TaxID=40576 RepID=UPI00237C6198|nr:Hcp family type VI secretion system effector [Xenorhabdus bovienii]MDE1488518.1 Hcp family type VI secretion system effector [Xenorhabdus bovienii]MDE9463434.1 Hcp family type VI secretion system effector [Xenorhabdus bovienii]MDE9471208.1 Hcp family type VI secretion system effector [Xenorhabdus bovienii]MDE9479379.1 Hcp family type VI secretion system effector [Xenorhabdus bovienii]MDE9532200.1 Hcp family type VI secretion system effector [Xenorhabdus bovienii]